MTQKEPTVALATALFLAVLIAGASSPVRAQSYTTVYQFTGGADGALPSTPLTFDSSGNAYGGTAGGGDLCDAFDVNFGCGTVYKLTQSGNVTTLVTFDGTNGAEVGTDLLLSGATLYGGTKLGAQNFGLLFSVKTDGSNFTILHVFTGRDGASPTGQLIPRPGGGFYGITSGGGPHYLQEPRDNYGVLYMLTAGGNLIPLHYFNDSDGKAPNAIIMRDGVIYGSTSDAGRCSGGCGTVFSYTVATGASRTLQYFDEHTGWHPMLGAVDDHGVLYGATQEDGPQKALAGTLFTLTPNNGVYTLTNIALFNDKNGADPSAPPLCTPSGLLIGTTLPNFDNAAPSLYLYNQDIDGHILPLVQFPGYDQTLYFTPTTQPVLGPSNVIYGTSGNGGTRDCLLIPRGISNGCGVIYSFPTPRPNR